MRLPRPLPYIAGLVLLAWLLSSIASGRAGGGLLINASWLYYLAYLAPAVPVGIMLVMVYFIVSNIRGLSLPTRFKKKPRKREEGKPRIVLKEASPSSIKSIILLGASTITTALFIYNCSPIVSWPELVGPLYCVQLTGPSSITGIIQNQFFPGSTGPTGPFQGVVFTFTRAVASPWFQLTFLSLVAVTSVLTARSLLLSQTDAKKEPSTIFRDSGLKAVKHAIKTVRASDKMDPRTRILECYQQILKAASQLGASVAPNQTARELERELRLTFRLQGSSIGELTRLFEEARYSLHPMTEGDCGRAYDYLIAVEDELGQSFNQA